MPGQIGSKSMNFNPILAVFHAQSNCWEFFIALAENSSLLLLKILYWEFFIALAENSSLHLLKILYWEFLIALAENSSLLLLGILHCFT